jgi:GNAT superfamily N-acetyltransferase
MAAFDILHRVELSPDDIGAGMALSTEAHWNQIEPDWLHFVTHGHAFGMRDETGRLVASAAALPYDGPFGYVGMVLVTQDFRRRGIATELVAGCIDVLRERSLIPVLDATAAGAEVYRKQGFLPQFAFDRWEGRSEGGAAIDMREETATISALDASAFGARRNALMEDFLRREGTRCVGPVVGKGFAMIRRGRRAWQTGPVVAAREADALDMVRRLFGTIRGAVFIDVPARWRALGAWLAGRGFSIQRSFTRMALGRSEPFGDPLRLFAVAGPEFG